LLLAGGFVEYQAMGTPEKRSGSSQRKMTNLLVLPHTQLKIVMGVTLFMLTMAIFFCFIFVLLIRTLLAPEILVQLPSWRIYLLPIFMAGFIFIVFAAGYGLIISHRIAGPIFQLMRVIREVAGGDMKARVHFRPDDEFSELSTDFNAMMDKLSNR
jgi:methyl-accepting chemotaxis protein